MKFLKAVKDKINSKIKEKQEQWKEDRKFNAEIRTVEKEAALKERKKQVVETAIFKEQTKAKKQRDYIKQGGLFGALSKGVDNISKSTNTKQKASKGKKVQQPESDNETILERLNKFELKY